MQSAICQKANVSSGLHEIPELIDLLSESTSHASDSKKLESISLEDILNFDCDTAEDTADSDREHTSFENIDKQLNPSSHARHVIQDPFDELAISPRNEPCCDLGSFADLCFNNFPRARSSGHPNARNSIPSGESIYEPVRPWTSAVPAPPPRRFYKFWWRGIVRGAHDAARAARFADAAQLAGCAAHAE
jgi:hypothetical protein